MFTELLTVATVDTFVKAWKASDLDEKALKTLGRAHSRHADALYLYETAQKTADDSLRKLVNRKKAMLSTRMKEFLSVYQKIKEIDFRPGDGILELEATTLSVQATTELRHMTLSTLKHMSEKELLVQYVFTGIGGAILADSKRNASIADNQKRISNVMYSQAEIMSVAILAISERCEQIAALLAKFSVLFASSIQETDRVIKKNRSNRDLFTLEEIEELRTCINLAGAIKAILDAPILNADGTLTELSLSVLLDGERRLSDLSLKIGG